MDIRSISSGTPPESSALERASAALASVNAAKSSAPVETAVAVPSPSQAPSPEQVAQALKSINKALEKFSQGLEFSVDEELNRTIVKVVDQQTKQVIRQIPTEEVIEIAKALDQTQGLLIRQKV